LIGAAAGRPAKLVRVGEPKDEEAPVSCGSRAEARAFPPLACSYRPGGRADGTTKLGDDMQAEIRCIPIAKSVESRDPRLRVSAKFLKSDKRGHEVAHLD
jgi:hypothetical protein